MSRAKFRLILLVVLCLLSGFASWVWLRPYAWNPDPGARCKVVAAQVRQDRSFYWLDLHLKPLDGDSHDLMKPVRLVTSSGREIEPADTTLGGKPGRETTDLWFKFWLEPQDFEGPLHLRINEGKLKIRGGSGVPRLGRSGMETFPTSNW
ncbi:MAG TPA: hypothetical protein VLO11_01035 [Luteolibacter sp.]|nr:hypothetical protein [Luteolibacter sp.]